MNRYENDSTEFLMTKYRDATTRKLQAEAIMHDIENEIAHREWVMKRAKEDVGKANEHIAKIEKQYAMVIGVEQEALERGPK